MTAGRKPVPDLRVGRLAILEGWLDEAGLRNCLREQERLRRLGEKIRLGQILIRRDLISTTQLVRLLEKQKDLRAGHPPSPC